MAMTQKEIDMLIENVKTGVYTIEDALKEIADAAKGKDVRKALYALGYTLNQEGKAGSVDLLAREELQNKASKAELNTETSERKQEIAVERSRIDNLSKMEEGSTTGDAELQDIRVGADGKIYDNAGEAVRGQIWDTGRELRDFEKVVASDIRVQRKHQVGMYIAPEIEETYTDYAVNSIAYPPGKYKVLHLASDTVGYSYLAKDIQGNNITGSTYLKEDTTFESEYGFYITLRKGKYPAVEGSGITDADLTFIDNNLVVTRIVNENGNTLEDRVKELEGSAVSLDETLTDPAKAAPADVVGKLKGDIIDLATFERYPNLITDYTLLEGRLLNNVGSVETNDKYDTFKVGVPVEAGKTYHLSANGKAVTAKVVFTTTESTTAFVTPISFFNNVSGGTCPEGATYMQFSIFKSTVNALDVILQEGETSKEDSITINENVRIPRLDKISDKVDVISDKVDVISDNTKKDLFVDRTEIINCQLNTVGWTESAEGFSTNEKGIKVKPNTWYTIIDNTNENTIEAKYITEKTADDILYYVQSTFIERTHSKRMIFTSENTEYLFITVTNEQFANVGVVEGFSKYNPLSNSLWTNGKKLMTLGDSLTAFGGWQPNVLGKLGFSDFINLGVGGTKVNVFADNVTVENISDVDVITVMGFFNSSSSVPGTIDDEASNANNASICSGYKYIIDKLLTLKPTVNIVLITPHTPRADDTKPKAEAVKEVAKYYHLPCIDLYNEAGFNAYTFDYYLIDTVHSSESGYIQEAKVICGKMQHYLC